MANEEHLKILEQGIRVWKKWRKENPDIKPDITEANLKYANLSYANLTNANLRNADLFKAKLLYTDLRNADLTDAYLGSVSSFYADLTDAILIGADFFRDSLMFANLTNANLLQSKLIKAYLKGVDLREACLVRANLLDANLAFADLTDANLTEAYLAKIYLEGANLTNANLSSADLREAYLEGANLTEANLSSADLREACLVRANLTEANLYNSYLRYTDLSEATLTGACLYDTVRLHWGIKGVKCEYVFFDRQKRRRIPIHNNFKIGEFERLYRSIPTVEIVFKEGIKPWDPIILEYVAYQSQQEEPELGLELLSIDKRGYYQMVVFAVISEKHKDKGEKYIIEKYDTFMRSLKCGEITLEEISSIIIQQGEMTAQSMRILESGQQDLKSGQEKILGQIDEATRKILEKKDVTEDQIKKFSQLIEGDKGLLNTVKKIRNDSDGFKENFKLLKPELEKAFARKFDARSTKAIKAICKAALSFLPADIVGDQIDWKI